MKITGTEDELDKIRSIMSKSQEFAEQREYIDPPVHSDAKLKKLKEAQRKFGLGSSSGRYAAHVYQVFNDPDFDSDIKVLRKKFEKLYYKNISLTTDYKDKHLLVQDKEMIKAIADKYCITLQDLGIYADKWYEAGGRFGRRVYEYGGFIGNNEQYYDNMQYFYALGPKTTLEQIAQDWDMIQEYMIGMFTGIKTKSKSPENPALIYAVFKARTSKNLTFTQIFKQYQDGILEGYGNTNTNQYSSKDSLERYYRKYMPESQHEIVIELE